MWDSAKRKGALQAAERLQSSARTVLQRKQIHCRFAWAVNPSWACLRRRSLMGHRGSREFGKLCCDAAGLMHPLNC